MTRKSDHSAMCLVLIPIKCKSHHSHTDSHFWERNLLLPEEVMPMQMDMAEDQVMPIETDMAEEQIMTPPIKEAEKVKPVKERVDVKIINIFYYFDL